jgi:hypothetical protein
MVKCSTGNDRYTHDNEKFRYESGNKLYMDSFFSSPGLSDELNTRAIIFC